MNKTEKTCLAFVKAVAADRFETAADAKIALDAFDPGRIYVLQELVDSFLLSSLWEAAEEEEAEEMDEDEDEDFDDEDEDDFDDEDEDEDTTAPVVRITKKTAKKASKKASGRR